MPRKTKPEYELYEMEVSDWNIDCGFGVNMRKRYITHGNYIENHGIILMCKLISPAVKNVSDVKLYLLGDPKLDDHWNEPDKEDPTATIGNITILRGGKTMVMLCTVPTRTVTLLSTGAVAGKIKYASAYGTRVKWGFGYISRVSFLTEQEEE